MHMYVELSEQHFNLIILNTFYMVGLEQRILSAERELQDPLMNVGSK